MCSSQPIEMDALASVTQENLTSSIPFGGVVPYTIYYRTAPS